MLYKPKLRESCFHNVRWMVDIWGCGAWSTPVGPALRHSWSIQSNSSSNSDMQAVSYVAQTLSPDIVLTCP